MNLLPFRDESYLPERKKQFTLVLTSVRYFIKFFSFEIYYDEFISLEIQ